MKRLILSITATVLLSAGMMAQNPIIHDQFSADPSALVVGDRVYVFPSHDIPAPEDYARKDWFCMQDYHVFSSSDLVHWVDHGVILNQKDVPWGDPKAYSMWAPDCAEHNGQYVFFFPDAAKPAGPGGFGGFRCGTAVADRPEGPYTPRENYIEGVFGIDPCIFKDDDGTGYLVWPSRGIKICKLNDDWSQLDGKVVPMPIDPAIPDSIRRRMPPMTMVEGTITVDEVPTKGLVEGPYMFKANGHYYVTFPWARENTECLAYCMADDINGPYKFMGSFFDEHANGCWTNHHSIVNFKDQWYIFYHHNKYSPTFDKNRSVCIDSLFFEPDGRIRKVTPSLRGVGITPASEPVQIDRYSDIDYSGACIEYLDMDDCFKGWAVPFDSKKGAWVKYNSVLFDEGTVSNAFVRVNAPNGGEVSILIDGRKAATVKINAAEGWQTVSAPMKGVKPGVHNITVTNSGGKALTIDWVSFSETTACENPLTNTDIPDNDFIRVGDDFYMVSTTMYLCPGVPIMHSKDLVHWRIINYLCESIEDDDIYNLRDGKNAYGHGQWATSIRYHDGTYYVLFCSNDQQKSYVYKTSDIYGKWEKTTLDRHFHDASLLFDEGHVYLVWGNGDLRITELEPDLSAVKKGGVDQLLIESPKEGYMLRAEGSHFYHIGDWYYVLEIDWPAGGHRTETCWRSRTLLGPYERKVVLSGRFDGRRDGVAQGAIVETQKGDWYAMMFQDHGAVGRIPTLQPVKWVDGWPILGDNTSPVKAFYVNLPESGENYVYADDDFDYRENDLQMVWQWNHKPDNSFWSVTERPGWLRLKGVRAATGVLDAVNTLSQRTIGPECTSGVLMDASGLKPGDHAGICAFQSNYCRIGVTVMEDGSKWLEAVTRHPKRTGFGIGIKDTRLESEEEEVVYRAPLAQNEVCLRLHYVFTPENGWKKAVTPFPDGEKWKTGGPDKAYMSFSYDGKVWTEIPVEFQMRYTLDLFTGYRTALYCYPTLQNGGYADFDWYKISARNE